MKKRLISALLLIAVVASMLHFGAVSAFAAEPTVITVSSANALPGEMVNVDVGISGNPGVLGAKLTFTFDEELTLVSASNGEAFSPLAMTKPGKLTSPCSFTWDGQELEDSDIKNGTILKLCFKVDESAMPDTSLAVTATCTSNGIVDKDLKTVKATIVNGNIEVIDRIYGDLNGDLEIDISDVILLRRLVAGGYNLTVDEKSADVNSDNSVDITDIILLRRFIAGGYDIVFPYGADTGKSEQEDDAAKEHAEETESPETDPEADPDPDTPVVDPEPDVQEPDRETDIPEEDTEPGATPTTSPTEEREYEIVYDISNGDSYLAKQRIENRNPDIFTETSEFSLKSLSVPGYRFLGWYDGAGENATQVKKISAGTTEDLELFAHWQKIQYTVQLKSDIFIGTEQLTYTVDTGVVLPTPKMSNYVFCGWSDEEGHLYTGTTIPSGTTGNLCLRANWTSERNKTYTKAKLDDPIIYEDEENKVIYIGYEIGEVQNVPLYEIYNFGYISENGVAKTVTRTYRTEYSENLMKSYATSVSKATVQSSDWTLSDGWTKNTYVDQEWASENGYSEEEANEVCKSDTGEWNISSGTYGSTEKTVVDSSQSDYKSEAKIGASTTDSGKVTDSVQYSNKNTASTKTTLDVGVEATASVESTTTVGASVGASAYGASAEVSAEESIKAGLSTTLSSDLSTEESQTRETSSSHSTSGEIGHEAAVESSTTGSNGVTTLHSNSSTTTTGWNSAESYGRSSTNSSSQKATIAITEKINETLGYGESIGEEISKTSHQGLSATEASSDEYSSSVAYTTGRADEVTGTWTTMNTKGGYHRWVVAGTAHVFAVVAYDMATQTYSVFTYSVMDEKTHEFEDYSYTTAAFNDNENGVISFEIPEFVSTYVANRCFATRGLQVNMDTGVITGYVKDNLDGTYSTEERGEYSVVVIPEYYNVGNGDVVKVTGISSNAFRGNTNIKAVVLSDFITEIPDNAFAGCTSLIGIGADSRIDANGNYYGSNIHKIGKNAFDGCVSFTGALVPAGVTEIGSNAFRGVGTIIVDPSSSFVAKSALTSGAKEIILNLNFIKGRNGVLDNVNLDVPAGVEKFILNGYGNTLSNTAVNSNAGKTEINKVAFTGSGIIPLNISSSEAVLNQVTITSSGLGLVLSGSTTHLGLQGTNSVSTSGKYAVLAKNLNLYQSNTKAAGKLSSNNTARVCGTIANMSLFNGTVEYIDEDKFDKMLNSYTLTFDANGGSCQASTMQVDNCTAIGTLPTATRTGYGFEGWYTDKNGGNKVSADTVYSDGNDRTLYAHWTANAYTVSYNTNGGTEAPSAQTKYHDISLTLSQTVPTKTGCTFLGWSYNGTRYQPGSKFTVNNSCTLTAEWKTNSYVLYFNSCSGSCSEVCRNVVYGNTYGTLPTPTRDYYTFNGWYTAADGGTAVNANTVFSSANNITIYAHWTQNSVSGWVKASSVPSGAQIISTKWEYTQRETTSSANSSMSGWTKYDTIRTSWGTEQGPVNQNPANGSRNVRSEEYIASYTHHYKYYHKYGWYNNGGTWMYCWSKDAWASTGERHTIDLTYPLESYYNRSFEDTCYRYYTCPNGEGSSSNQIWFYDGEYDVPNYATRWYYQEPIYTYYFERYVSKTTTNGDPTGQTGVSNVVKYVQYRAK